MTSESVHRFLAAALVCWIGWPSAHAARPELDAEHLVVGFHRQGLPGTTGHLLDLDWVGRFGRGVISVGAEVSEAADSEWRIVKLGGALALASGWTVSGGLDVGPATTAGDAFTFKRARIELDVPIGASWSLVASEMSFDVEPVVGHVVGIGARVAPADGWRIEASAAASVGGTMDERRLMVRVDYRRNVPYLMAGVVVGRSNHRLLLDVPAIDPRRGAFRQAFFGIGVPFERFEIMAILDGAELNGYRRGALAVVFRVPIPGYKDRDERR